jgi:hypothetical protein
VILLIWYRKLVHSHKQVGGRKPWKEDLDPFSRALPEQVLFFQAKCVMRRLGLFCTWFSVEVYNKHIL